MAFEKYTGHAVRGIKETVTLRANRYLAISRDLVQRFKGEKSDYIYLYYDKDTYQVAIQFIKGSPKEDFPMRLVKESAGGVCINFDSFMKSLGVEMPSSRFMAAVRKDTKLLTFSIAKMFKDYEEEDESNNE